MFGSAYQSLLTEESRLPRPPKGQKVPMDFFLKEIVEPRGAFAKKIEAAYNNGKITKSQFDELTNLNRQHSLNI